MTKIKNLRDLLKAQLNHLLNETLQGQMAIEENISRINMPGLNRAMEYSAKRTHPRFRKLRQKRRKAVKKL